MGLTNQLLRISGSHPETHTYRQTTTQKLGNVTRTTKHHNITSKTITHPQLNRDRAPCVGNHIRQTFHILNLYIVSLYNQSPPHKAAVLIVHLLQKHQMIMVRENQYRQDSGAHIFFKKIAIARLAIKPASLVQWWSTLTDTS